MWDSPNGDVDGRARSAANLRQLRRANDAAGPVGRPQRLNLPAPPSVSDREDGANWVQHVLPPNKTTPPGVRGAGLNAGRSLTRPPWGSIPLTRVRAGQAWSYPRGGSRSARLAPPWHPQGWPDYETNHPLPAQGVDSWAGHRPGTASGAHSNGTRTPRPPIPIAGVRRPESRKLGSGPALRVNLR